MARANTVSSRSYAPDVDGTEAWTMLGALSAIHAGSSGICHAISRLFQLHLVEASAGSAWIAK